MGTKILAGAFGILGVLLLVNGLMSLPVALLLVGPHGLAASLGCGAFGALGISVAFGFDRGRDWAWKAGLLWTIALLAIALTAFYQSGVEEDAAGRIFYAIMSGILGSVLIVTMVGWIAKRKYRNKVNEGASATSALSKGGLCESWLRAATPSELCKPPSEPGRTLD